MTDDSAGPSIPSDGDTDSTGDSRGRADAFRDLQDRRRRYVLRCLRTSETPMALADLADELVRWETDASPSAVQDARERLYASLYHCHLPELANKGLIEFDTDQNLVSSCEAVESVDRPSVDEHLQKSLTDNAESQYPKTSEGKTR